MSRQTIVVGLATMICWNSGNAEELVDWRYTGCRYRSESPTGTTIRLPRTTLLPLWFQSVIWALIVGSASMRDSIWAGPKIVVLDGNWYTRTVP